MENTYTYELKLFIDDILQSELVFDVNLSKSINRFYDILTFRSKKLFPTDSNVTLNEQFKGYIHSVQKTDAGYYDYTCRSVTAKIGEPFIPFATSEIEPVSSRLALFDFYSNKYGVNIDAKVVDINFVSNFVRSGTPLNAIDSVCGLTKCEYWCDFDKIVIEPKSKPAQKRVKSFNEDMIYRFKPFYDEVVGTRCNVCYIGEDEESVSDYFTTLTKCTIEVDDCTKIATIKPVPYDVVESVEGLKSYDHKNIQASFYNVLTDEESIEVNAEIKEVQEVTLNGYPFDAYKVRNNLIIFNNPISGIVNIKYLAKVIQGEVAQQHFVIDGKNITYYDIKVNKGKLAHKNGTLSCTKYRGDGDKFDTIFCDETKVLIPRDLKFFGSISFYTIGSKTPTVYATDGLKQIFINDTVEDIPSFAMIMNPILNKLEDSDKWGVIVDDANEIKKVLSYNEPLEFDFDSETKQLTVNEHYENVKVCYRTEAKKHTITITPIPPKSFKLHIGKCEYMVYSNGSDISDCDEGTDIVVDIPSYLGTIPHLAIGENVTINGVVDTVDDCGTVTIPNAKKGKYKIDTSNIEYGTSIYVNANLKPR